MNIFEQDILRKKEKKIVRQRELERQQRLTREFSDEVTRLIGIEPTKGNYHTFNNVIPGYHLYDTGDYIGQNRPDAPGDGKPFWNGWRKTWFDNVWLYRSETERTRFLNRLKQLLEKSQNNNEPSPFWRENDLVKPITAWGS